MTTLARAEGVRGASYGFGDQTGRCAPGLVPVAVAGVLARARASGGSAGCYWLAALAAEVGQCQFNGGVGLDDAELAGPIPMLLPADPSGAGAVGVVQGVPGQAEQAVQVDQHHLGLLVVGVAWLASSRRSICCDRVGRSSARGRLLSDASDDDDGDTFGEDVADRFGPRGAVIGGQRVAVLVTLSHDRGHGEARWSRFSRCAAGPGAGRARSSR
jgi:hypothetical protein